MPDHTIANPILKGFNPDPSICRVDDDYYLAVSTFEWYPGVQIYHSKDLANWRLVARPLARASLLDMRGEPDSCGIWAPCLTYADGKFWLCFTDVKRFDGNFKDTHNYVTTSAAVDGEWSEPTYLNSSGFDPSLFHDDDGRKWFLNMIWDHRPDRTFFYGIVLQEYDASSKQLIGPSKRIFSGSSLGYTEGPHLYKHGGYYHLITAEGGTGYGHAVTMARSRTIDSGYELDPSGPLLTTGDDPDWPLQRNGHGDIVEAATGEWYLVHLCGRPLPGTRRCPLGRETALQRLKKTDDGWFRLASGERRPALEVDVFGAPNDIPTPSVQHDDFTATELSDVYQWLRTPYPEAFMSLSDNPGHLRLYGMESPGSLYHQALIARRQTAFVFEASTAVDFRPQNFQQMAGLICYYNSRKFHYLYLSTDSDAGKHLGILSCEARSAATFPVHATRVPVAVDGRIWLRAQVDHAALEFSWSSDGEEWSKIPITLDYSLLSDEAGMGGGEQFTGAFVGMCCNDLTGGRLHADFEYFRYAERDH